MSTDETYNGWRNYATRCVKLWIDNDQGAQEHWLETAEDCLRQNAGDMDDAASGLRETLENDHEEAKPELEGMWSDLLNHAFGGVDWHEIAQAFVSEVVENREYELKRQHTEIFEVSAAAFVDAFQARDGSWHAERMNEKVNDDGLSVEDAADELSGVYWWTGVPGCLPDSDAMGPFKTVWEAQEDALGN